MTRARWQRRHIESRKSRENFEANANSYRAASAAFESSESLIVGSFPPTRHRAELVYLCSWSRSSACAPSQQIAIVIFVAASGLMASQNEKARRLCRQRASVFRSLRQAAADLEIPVHPWQSQIDLSQTARRFSALVLPRTLSVLASNESFWPSSSEFMPARSTALI